MKLKQRVSSLLALCAVALVFAAPVASAQTATQQGYDESGVLGSVQETSADNGAGVQSVGTTDNADSLPFTGADLGIVLAMGLVLGVTGLVLRRTVRRPTA